MSCPDCSQGAEMHPTQAFARPRESCEDRNWAPEQVRNLNPGIIPHWAAAAEEAGFSTLGSVGRYAYPGVSDTIALAVAAAVTRRIGLLSMVLLAPTWLAYLLAKEVAGIDGVSAGRLTLGSVSASARTISWRVATGGGGVGGGWTTTCGSTAMCGRESRSAAARTQPFRTARRQIPLRPARVELPRSRGTRHLRQRPHRPVRRCRTAAGCGRGGRRRHRGLDAAA